MRDSLFWFFIINIESFTSFLVSWGKIYFYANLWTCSSNFSSRLVDGMFSVVNPPTFGVEDSTRCGFPADINQKSHSVREMATLSVLRPTHPKFFSSANAAMLELIKANGKAMKKENYQSINQKKLKHTLDFSRVFVLIAFLTLLAIERLIELGFDEISSTSRLWQLVTLKAD